MSLGAFVLAAAGCPQPPPVNPFISASVDGDETLLSDGTQTRIIKLQAQDGEGGTDESAATATVTEGEVIINLDEDDETVGDSVVVPMPGGFGEFAYRCERLANGIVTIEISNGNATVMEEINCTAPPANVQINLDQSDCLPELSAIEGTGCRVGIEAALVYSGAPEALDAETLTVEVTDISNVITDGAMGQPEDGNGSVLSPTPSGPNVSAVSSIALTTRPSEDDSGYGVGEFYVIAPQTGLEQTLRITVTASSQPVPNSAEITVRITGYQPQYALVIDSTSNVSADAETPIRIELTADATSEPEESVAVVLTPQTPGQFATDANNPIALAESGTDTYTLVLARESGEGIVPATYGANVTLDLPPLVAGVDTTQVALSATFSPGQDAPDLVASRLISVNRPGVLLLNANLASATILADQAATGGDQTLISITLSRDGAPENELVTVSIDQSATDRAELIGPNGPTDSATLTPTDGSTEIQIQAQDEQARGLVPILVSVVDDSVTPAVTREVELELLVDRTPVLQSVVFLSAAPESLGVQGSALPGSSILTFQAFFDDGQPADNASVSFSLPASADPAATVVPFGSTGGDGIATTVLSSGTQAGPLTVTATVTLANNIVAVESFPVAVVGGLPNFAQSYLVCETENVIHVPPVTADCQAVIADRFSNQIDQPLTVQFRAEGGNITPFATLGGSSATGTYVTGSPGRASADIYGWSYGVVVPAVISELETSARFDAAARTACGDSSAASACDLYSLCNEGQNDAYCPLPVDDTGASCWDTIPKAALAILGVETAECSTTVPTPTGDPANPGDRQVTCTDGTNFTIDGGEFGVVKGVQYATDPEVKALLDEYRETNLDCGFPTACLVGRADGFGVLAGDECSAALGCFDFAGQTNCAQTGLVSVMASVRGEEAFVDANGNGVFDFDDVNGNGRHDVSEPAYESFVDMPEPFLDKVDNCTMDDYNGHPRLLPIEEVIQSDIYSDVDNSQDFGFDDGTPVRKFVNGRFDRDTEIFVQSRLLALTSDVPTLSMGEHCTAAEALPGAGHTCSDGSLRTCNMITDTFGMADCPIPNLVTGVGPTSAVFTHAWHDGNGNCHSVGHAAETTVTTTGAIKIAGDVSAAIPGCGLGEGGETPLNAFRPYCTAAPSLGPQLGPNGGVYGAFVNSITLDCENGEGVEPATVQFAHSDGRTVEFALTTTCPEDA